MSDVKHTAGPWVAEDDELRPVCVRGEPNIHKTHTIARLSAWRCGTADEVAQAKANARLMAAAPTMYDQHEANIVDLEFLLAAVDADDPVDEIRLRINDIIRHTREALAKARGQQWHRRLCAEQGGGDE